MITTVDGCEILHQLMVYPIIHVVLTIQGAGFRNHPLVVTTIFGPEVLALASTKASACRLRGVSSASGINIVTNINGLMD